MAVKIHYGKPAPTPEQAFLKELQEWTIAQTKLADAAMADFSTLKVEGKSGLDAYKMMSTAHGIYANKGAIRHMDFVTKKLSELSKKHQPEF